MNAGRMNERMFGWMSNEREQQINERLTAKIDLACSNLVVYLPSIQFWKLLHIPSASRPLERAEKLNKKVSPYQSALLVQEVEQRGK